MKISINKEHCIGCGLCEELAPHIFEMGDYTAEVLKDITQEEDKQKIRDIIKDCPGEAVTILED